MIRAPLHLQACASKNAENALLAASLVEATNAINAADSRSSRSENNLAAVEARVNELDASATKANNALATKAAENDVLVRDLTVAREAVVVANDRVSALQIKVTGLDDACKEMSSRGGPTTRENALKADLANALKRCADVERDLDQCLPVYERQRKALEANAKERRKQVGERVKRLSADVKRLTLLQTEREKFEALAQEVCSAVTSEEPWGGGGGRGACRMSRFGLTESLENGPRASEAWLFFNRAGIDSKGGRICLGTGMSSGP